MWYVTKVLGRLRQIPISTQQYVRAGVMKERGRLKRDI